MEKFKYLRATRKATGQSLHDLAIAFGIAPARLAAIEDGEEPTLAEFEAMAPYDDWLKRYEDGDEQPYSVGFGGFSKHPSWRPTFLMWRPDYRFEGKAEDPVRRSVVAQGIRFDDGTVALKWLGAMSSAVIFDSWVSMKSVHGHGGETDFIYYDPRTKEITTPLPSFHGEVPPELRPSLVWTKTKASTVRTHIEEWGDSQANGTIGCRPPWWNGKESIKVTIFGKELEPEGGAVDVDYHDIEVTGEEVFKDEDISTVWSACDGFPEAIEALRRIQKRLEE